MDLEFFGAAGEVTGSCHILTCSGQRVLLDCGLIQGGRKAEKRNRDPFPFSAADIDAVVLSHAHIDHSGRLPLLIKRGFDGPIWAHSATGELCDVLLQDSAKLGLQDTKRKNRKRKRQGKSMLDPLYTTKDAQQALSRFRSLKYKEAKEILPGITVELRDAGHILGSCSVIITAKEKEAQRTLLFSGDLGQYDTPIIRDPAEINHADFVLMECTYGGRKHRDREATIVELGEIVEQARASGGNIIIPAFAVGRSQELLYMFGKYYNEWGMSDWKIFLDSPMAIKASKIYWDNPHLYDEEATRLHAKIDEMPPLPNLRLCKSADDSRRINKLKKGAIIIAGSGMCNGGRILHHLKHNIWRKRNHVIFAGYQAPGTLGRRIVDRRGSVKIYGENIMVAAQVHTVGGFSAHGDKDDMARWYANLENRPPVFLVHGEKKSAHKFKAQLHESFGTEVTLSDPGMRLDLVSGELIDRGQPLGE